MENNFENRDNKYEMSGNRYWDGTLCFFFGLFWKPLLKVPQLKLLLKISIAIITFFSSFPFSISKENLQHIYLFTYSLYQRSRFFFTPSLFHNR